MPPEEIIQSVVGLSCPMSRPVYRGQAASRWQPLSGAVRRLQAAYGDAFPTEEHELRTLVDRYHKEHLIMPMEVVDGAQLKDLQRLSVLQHLGAATALLDFTESVLVALWFACAGCPNEDGRVFVLDIGDHHVARNGRLMDNPFDAGPAVVYYEPDRSLGGRIIAQQSVFLICNPVIPDASLISAIVPVDSKGPLRDHLTRLGLSEMALFGDVPGLAVANSTRTPLQPTWPLSPGQHRDRGNRAYQAGRYEDALAAYQAYAEALPAVAQPHSLKADALAVLGRFEEADQAYTMALQNLGHPIYVQGHVVSGTEPLAAMMSRALFYNRGNVRAAVGRHNDAVADFDAALLHGYEPSRSVLLNRGNSKFALTKFAEAHEDFEAASSEREGSDASLAMGNCSVMLGRFEDALLSYIHGSTREPDGSAANCRANAEQLRRLTGTLPGNEHRVKHEGWMVCVEAEGMGRVFPLAGNTGNTGNTGSGLVGLPGGEGYEGMDGFAVSIRPPSSRKKITLADE